MTTVCYCHPVQFGIVLLISFFRQSRRIFPSLGVTILTIGLCYVFAETYQPPARKDRIWPDVPPAAATAIALLGANFAVYILWGFCPPAWRMMNRYFISVPLYPHALSVVGTVFSHQQLRHLATNMVILWFIGTRRELSSPFFFLCLD